MYAKGGTSNFCNYVLSGKIEKKSSSGVWESIRAIKNTRTIESKLGKRSIFLARSYSGSPRYFRRS